MKRLIVGFGVFLLVSTSAYAEMGLGLNARDFDSEIYVPIELSDSFRLEPSLMHYKNEYKYSDGSFERDFTEFSLGIFKKSRINEKVSSYYGTRFSYVEGESEQRYDDYENVESDTKGYAISPTLGVEYYLTPKISLSGEFAVRYQDTSYKDDYCCGDSDEKTVKTETDIVLRYFF